MANNFGLGSREMGKAGSFVCQAASRSGAMSFSTAGTISDRWQKFSEFARDQGIKKMEHVTRELVQAYGKEMAEAGHSPAYSQNLVSAVNSVMALATKGQWQSVSPTKDCEIEKRSSIREAAPGGLDHAEFNKAIQAMREAGMVRQAAIAELSRELGLRSKEASLIDCNKALQRFHDHLEPGTRKKLLALRNCRAGR